MSSNSTSISCFNRNENQKLDLYACSHDGSLAQCCEATDLCASNGLCARSDAAQGQAPYNIGGCTDSTWQDKGCVSQCKDSRTVQIMCSSIILLTVPQSVMVSVRVLSWAQASFAATGLMAATVLPWMHQASSHYPASSSSLP
jgi:hypothetical protein